MRQAVEAAHKGSADGQGGPFGAVVVKDGRVVGVGANSVVRSHDPTAHAEVTAIRDACAKLGTHELRGATLYTTCEPCPMCLAATYWARVDRVIYGATRDDAAAIGFDDEFLYREVALPIDQRQLPMTQDGRETALELFRSWSENPDKVNY